MGKIHDFNESLAIAEDAQTEVFWVHVYKKAFPDMIGEIKGKQRYTDSQIRGMDRIVVLENGKPITIEEKVRTKVYDDILLEYISNDNLNRPGWIEKDLSIDYLAYAFLPNKTVYLIDWRALSKAWDKHKEEWKKRYKIAKAGNKTYNAYSVCVPIDTLLEACKKANIITLT